MDEIAEVVIGAGQTFAERLAAARVEAAIALWAIPYGSDWAAAWKACPRPDWLVEMYMLGARVTPGSEEHRRVLRALREEFRSRADVFERDEERLLVDLTEGWIRGLVSEQVVQDSLRALQIPRAVAGTIESLIYIPLEWVQIQALSQAAYLLADGVTDPVAPSLCARALSYSLVNRPDDADLAARLAAALPCPEMFKPSAGEMS